MALQSDNDFQSEISSETYSGKFLKSVSTYKTVLNVKLADNVPGTKLEVILKIKDRIGFEDSDTFNNVCGYYCPTGSCSSELLGSASPCLFNCYDDIQYSLIDHSSK